MIARLAEFVAVFVIAILWLMGFVSQFHIVDISFLNQTLGDCWMQLTAGIHEKHYGYHRKIASRHPFLI
ncbi:MAG: hypothetical protein R3C53_27650 [Pirellulaceae bacterium]